MDTTKIGNRTSSVPGRICAGILRGILSVYWLLAPSYSPLLLGGQQPQTQTQVFPVNAKYVQGVGPGYWVTTGTWPNVNVAGGTAFCGNPLAPVTYPGGTLPMAASATNYVYLDPASNCAPASNTTGLSTGQIPLAQVITGSSSIPPGGITDLRTWFVPQPLGTDSTGHVEGTRFCDQFSGSTPCASAIANAGASGALVVDPASNSASTEAICGAGTVYSGITSLTNNTNGCSNGPNVRVWDFRDGIHVTNYDAPGNPTDSGGDPNVIFGNQWVGNRYRTNGYSQFMNVIENSFSQKVFDGGLNLDYQLSSPFYADKRVFQTVNIDGEYFTPAEHIPLNIGALSGATGDTIGMEVLTENFGGASTMGDEGLESAGFFASQVSDVYSGTICGPPTCAAPSQGATQITVSNAQAEAEQGAGRPLLDISKGSSGALASIGTYTLGGWTWPQYTGSGTSWTANSVLALTDAAIPGPHCTSSTTLPTTCTVTPANYVLGTNLSAVATSTPIVVADDGSYEVVKATSFSGSPPNAFTATFTKPHPQGAVVSIATSGACASGNAGVCAGYYVELVSDCYGGSGYSSTCGASPAVNCVRQVFPILAATDNTHLVPWAVGNNGIGYNSHGIAGSCSPPTCTTWQQSNQYYTYPGAEVLSWQQGGMLSDTATLAPNGVNWASVEAVENQHYWQFASSGNVISSVEKLFPYVGHGASSAMKIQIGGHGWQRAETALQVINYNDPSEYTDYVNGSPLSPPYLLDAYGLFYYGLWLRTAPSAFGGAAIRVDCPATQVNNGSVVNTNTNCSANQWVNDIVNSDAAGSDSLSLNPSTSQFALTASNGTKAYLFGASTLSVPQNIAPAFAGVGDIGSASLPFGNLWLGNTATNNIKVTGTATAARSQTLQDVTDTFVYRASADTLTNKTLTSPVINGGVTSAGAVSLSAGGTNQNVTLTPSGTGFTVLNGNVGVGTSTPAQKLDVNGAVRSALNTVAFSTTPAFDASLGNAQKITLTGNVTSSTLINASAGEKIDFIVCQDSTGSRTFVWPTNLKGGMTIGSTASKCSAQTFVFDGSNAFATSPGVTNM
jgi:hypothetical protein